MLIQVVEPVDRLAESKTLVRTDQKFSRVLVEAVEMFSVVLPLLVLFKVLLNVSVNSEAARFDELVKR